MALNLSSKNITKAVLRQYRLSPSKRLGQNFLIDKFAVKKVIKAAQLTKNEVVLEIGPGLGALTQALAKAAGRVITVEKDFKMVEILKNSLRGVKNVKIIQADVLKTPNTKYKIQDTRYKIVANLPFYLTAAVIRQFLESKKPPKEMILVVQKEVAQRICGSPPKMNLLSVSVQFYAKPKIVGFLSKKSFWPQPKVDSAILRITNLKPQAPKTERDLFFKVVKAGFSHPRKLLVNNLAKKINIEKDKVIEILQKNNISPALRSETLKISDWKKIARAFSVYRLL